MIKATEFPPLFRSFLIGASVPFAITLVFAVVGYVMALFGGRPDPMADLIFAGGVGLFLAVFGGLELAIGVFFFEGGRLKDRFVRALGFLIVWISLIGIFLKMLG